MASINTLAETGSTNDEVALLAREGAAEGLWLRAERQTGGRGRQGRTWQSPPGNLYASTLVRIVPGDPKASTLSLVSAVALYDVVKASVPTAPLLIKWPNDLLLDGAKLAGILLERHDDAVVAGFGVNLVDHPTDLERPATSLRAFAGDAPDPALLAGQLAERFAYWLARWRSDEGGEVRSEWLDRAHPVGTALSTTGPKGERIDGHFDGLDDQGSLRLRLDDSTVIFVRAGDVFLV